MRKGVRPRRPGHRLRPRGPRQTCRRFIRLAACGVVAWGVILCGIPPSPLQAADAPRDALDEAAEQVREFIEHTGDSYYTLVDEAGRTLTHTSLSLAAGDTYIASDNREYEVTGIDGNTVRTRYIGTVELPEVSSFSASVSIPETGPAGWWHRLTTAIQGAAEEKAEAKGPVAIYFTHSDESYVPTSGKSSEKKGDVYQVGHALKSALEDEGYEVALSENNHNPHDGQAYHRSRRTVTDLLEKGPSTMVDVHRDAVPAEEYKTTVNGEAMTKVRIVVGRQNQNREVNMQYAKRIKAVADEKFPGLIKGIFNAQGNYNQDVGPRMILLEFGTHENPLDKVQKSARLFAQVLPVAAGITPASSRGEAQGTGASGWRSALWVLLIAAVVAVGYVALNARSGGEVAERLRTFLRGQFPRVGNAGDGEGGDGGDEPEDGGRDRRRR